MKSINFRIANITRDYMIKNLDRFLAIESNWTDLGEEVWKEENFLLDLPLKWEISFAVENKDQIIGYLIGSADNPNVPKVSRVNKIVIDYKYHGHGIGKQLMSRHFVACRKRGVENSELKALVGNDRANIFYTKLGYHHVGVTKGTDGKFRNVYKKRLE